MRELVTDAAVNPEDGGRGVDSGGDTGTAAEDAALVDGDVAKDASMAVDAEATLQTEVWVGQLWSASPALCDPAADGYKDLRTWTSEGSFERVVLVLEPNARGELGGRIQIGDLEGRRVPQTPGPTVFTTAGDDGSFWLCSVYHATEGIEYTLFDVVRTNQAVRFSFSPNQVWDRWCRTDKPVCPTDDSALCHTEPFCECSDGQCTAETWRRVPVALAVTSETLEGHFVSTPFGTPSDIRLRRAK